MGHWGALHLSQHIRYEHCSLSQEIKPQLALSSPAHRQEDQTQTHSHSQHLAWPDLPAGEMWISVGTTSGAKDQHVESPTSIPAAPADQV